MLHQDKLPFCSLASFAVQFGADKINWCEDLYKLCSRVFSSFFKANIHPINHELILDTFHFYLREYITPFSKDENSIQNKIEELHSLKSDKKRKRKKRIVVKRKGRPSPLAETPNGRFHSTNVPNEDLLPDEVPPTLQEWEDKTAKSQVFDFIHLQCIRAYNYLQVMELDSSTKDRPLLDVEDFTGTEDEDKVSWIVKTPSGKWEVRQITPCPLYMPIHSNANPTF